MKLWSGRFTRPTDARVDDFHSSIGFDWRLYRHDIRGSQAHAHALAKAGIISAQDAQEIISGLEGILADIEAGKINFSVQTEDIHMNIETLLTQRIGEAGRRLHTARSRNDQVAVDTRMYLRQELINLEGMVCDLQKALLTLAKANDDVILPGYTHLQPAQPVLFAHHLLAYVEMLQRDRQRLANCYERTNICPLGAGALAGVAYPLDRAQVATELGFADITANSIDAVSDRDYILEFMAAASIMMMHISRLCEEIVLWASAEFDFVELDDAFSTGSSIMPQKKNPDVAELARGKTGRVYGHLVSLLTVMKGLPLAYNKDMQEDKEALFDTIETCAAVLSVLAPMVASMQVNRECMQNACCRGFLNATDLADYLVGKGIPFRKAHELVGQIVLKCLQQGVNLEQLSLKQLQAIAPQVQDDVYAAICLPASVAARNVVGGTAPQAVAVGLERAQQLTNKRLLQ